LARERKLPVQVTDDTLRKLVEIAAISTIDTDQFKKSVRDLIAQMWAFDHLINMPDEDDDPSLGIALSFVDLEASAARFIAAARELVSSSESFRRAATEAYPALREQNKFRRQYLERLFDVLGKPRSPADPRQTSGRIATFIRTLLGNFRSPRAPDDQAEPKTNGGTVSRLVLWSRSILESEPKLNELTEAVNQQHKHQRRASAGRPSSAVSELRHLFVHGLLSSVEEAGGKLTFNKNHETNGTHALRVLAPFLPNRLIPYVPPLSTLAGHYSQWKREKGAFPKKLGTSKA
jgi:hypothetical protein